MDKQQEEKKQIVNNLRRGIFDADILADRILDSESEAARYKKLYQWARRNLTAIMLVCLSSGAIVGVIFSYFVFEVMK